MYVNDKVALITGGAAGLGIVYAKELLKNGLKGVTLADVDVDKGEEAAKKINQTYGAGKAIFVKVDVVNKNEVEDAMKRTVECFGNLDILINNAGILNEAMWEREVDVNLKGTVNGCILAFEKYLPKYKTGLSEPTIVNIASVVGLRPFFSMPVYCATKLAVVAISKVFAMEENYGSQKIRILTLCPGATATTIGDTLEAKSFTSRHTEVLKKLGENHSQIQQPEELGPPMVKILESGENGSVWIMENGELYQIEVPNQKDMKILRHLQCGC